MSSCIDIPVSNRSSNKEGDSANACLIHGSEMSQIPNLESLLERCAIKSDSRETQPFMSPNRGRRLLISPLPLDPGLLDYPKTKPKWYDSTYRELVHLATSNQQKPIPKEELLKIQKTAEEIIAVKDRMQSLLFLKLLSEFSFYGCAEIFFHMLQNLRAANPDINQYFYDISIKSGAHPMLNEKGLAQILHFFSEEYDYPKGILKTAGASQIPSLVVQLMEGEDDSMRGWAVSNDQDSSDPHIVPVFAIRKEGKTHVFIFDSVGHVFSTNIWQQQISVSLENLIEYFQDQPDKLDQLAIYSYKFPRQTSDFDCAVFTLLDLKNLLEMHLKGDLNIIEFYQYQEKTLRPKRSMKSSEAMMQLPIFELSTLPPQMMKVTQSFKKIDSYERKLPIVLSSVSVKRYIDMTNTSTKVQDLREMLTRIHRSVRIDGKNRLHNHYAIEKHMKLIVYLLCDSVFQSQA